MRSRPKTTQCPVIGCARRVPVAAGYQIPCDSCQAEYEARKAEVRAEAQEQLREGDYKNRRRKSTYRPHVYRVNYSR